MWHDIISWDYQSKAHKNTGREYKIPFMIHRIWFSDPENPVEVEVYHNEDILEKGKKSIEMFKNLNPDYKIILWINTFKMPKTIE